MISEPNFIITPGGSKIRILGPFEVDNLVSAIGRDYLRNLFNMCFWTGMRYTEIQYLHASPGSYSDSLIHLKMEKTTIRTTPPRDIPVPTQIQDIIPEFFKSRSPPTGKVWNDSLKRWAQKSGITSEGIVPKTTRMSIESWMVAAEIPYLKICQRQGYNIAGELSQYHSVLFDENEKIEIVNRLSGW